MMTYHSDNLHGKGRQWKGRSKASFWSFLRCDDYLRKTIEALMSIDDRSLRKLSKDAGVYPDRISRYLRKTKHGQVNDLQLLRLCDELGIDVELKITVKEPENA